MWKILLFAVVLFCAGPSFCEAGRISLLVIDADAWMASEAVKGLALPPEVEADFFTFDDLKDRPDAEEFVRSSDVILVDVMMAELAQYILERPELLRKKVFAMRGGRDNEKLEKAGFVFDPALREYYQHHTAENLRNLVYRTASMAFDRKIAWAEPVEVPPLRIYHPDAPEVFTAYDDYLKWYTGRPVYKKAQPVIGLLFFSSFLSGERMETIHFLIRRLEQEGFSVIPSFGPDLDVLETIFTDEKKQARVDMVLAFSLKFYSSLDEKVRDALTRLDVPLINLIHLYGSTVEEWKQSPLGLPPLDVAWNIAHPEISGVIEPTPVSGKVPFTDPQTGRRLYQHLPIKENIELLVRRVQGWTRLKHKANPEKRVAILYYNHSQGKQNIGASYLNVFNSLSLILERMRTDGYQVRTDMPFTEDAVKEQVLRYGRNIGSWAPGELDNMIREGNVVRLPVSEYKKWFARLPEVFRQKVIAQWGEPEDCKIMIRDGNFIIPAVIMGRVLMMPEPSRGWGDDPMKLYHDPELYPHHQYIAAYLWLKYGFGADAMIHLGTHATHEWLPGKQAGLSAECPPEVLVTDIPNLYPYIVDDVGEGVQAKRRGRAVIIDHMTPPLREGGLYHEYAALYDLIGSWATASVSGSQTAEPKKQRIAETVRKLGLDKDLGIMEMDDAAISKVEHYLLELQGNFMPYGMHCFGRSPDGAPLEEMTACISGRNREAEPEKVKKSLEISGAQEMDRLMKGLNSGYIPSGEGNDPVRNPSAIPTGKNFYGFNPDKIPSKEAWELGKEAAEQIIRKHLEEKKTWPEKVAVVLWATEAIRNEGINESTILWLMGLKPVWNASGRVQGVSVVPGKTLGRPRIDVLMTPSGLYRDLFPNMLVLLDNAVRTAAAQDDIENLIAANSAAMKKRLAASGMAPEKAETFSQIRIFTEKPGVYGTGVSEMTEASGVWESDDEVVDVYERRVGFAFGQGKWGEAAQDVFRENLKDVKVAVHSISSNVYGTMDNDDMFQYLGGLSLAVKKASGQSPDTLISMQRVPGQVTVENAGTTIGRELRTRYLNPKWIEGMKKDKYAGAREISKFVDYMWGWQVTVPSAVDKTRWEQTFEVYVEDKYGLDIKAFFDRENPWAWQAVTARMLEAVRKEYWSPDEKTRKALAEAYIRSVAEKGVSCSGNVCDNPALNQKVLELADGLPPDLVEKFRKALEEATRKTLDEQMAERQALREKLLAGPQKNAVDKASQAAENGKAPDNKAVEGFKMEDIQPEKNMADKLSPKLMWAGPVFVFMIIGLFVFGMKRGRKQG